MSKEIVSICDVSTRMVQPWVAVGYRAWCIDIQHPPGVQERDGIVYVGADVRYWTPPPDLKPAFAAAFPPCTDLAVSGARWFKSKGLRALSEAIDVFGAAVELVEAFGCPGFVENPVSVISSHYRRPDFTFNPCDYGDPYTKKTCLWAFGGFEMPDRDPVEPTQGSKMHLMPPSPERAKLRSETPGGFADAVFKKYGATEVLTHATD